MLRVTIGNEDRRALLKAIQDSTGEFNVGSSYFCLGSHGDFYVLVDKNHGVHTLHKNAVISPLESMNTPVE